MMIAISVIYDNFSFLKYMYRLVDLKEISKETGRKMAYHNEAAIQQRR